MGNRHTFDLTLSTRNNFEVVSANRTVFDLVIDNRHVFDLPIAEGFAVGYFWEVVFRQSQQMLAATSLTMNLSMEITTAQALTAVPKIGLSLAVSASTVLNGEATLSQALNLGGVSASATQNAEPFLQQRLLIGQVEESNATLVGEIAPEYRHYFLLNNYSGSLLSDLDSLLLQNMDYEIV